MRRLLALLLLAACSLTRGAIVYVDRQPGLDGSWHASRGSREAHLAARGSEATLEFRGRTFVLREAERLRGRVAADEVYLVWHALELTLTDDAIRLVSRGRVLVDEPLPNAAAGRRLVVEPPGRLRLE